MKTQERVMREGNGTLKTISTATSTKKKSKPRVVKGKKEEVGKVIIEGKKRDSNREFAEVFNAEEVVMVMDWDEWPCFLCSVVEQLSWGTCWDMELIGKELSHAFYSDAAWDDDISDLKDINKGFPAPSEIGGLLEN